MGKRKQVQVPIEKIEEQNRFIEAIAENHVSNAGLTAGKVKARDFIRKFIK